MNSEKVEPDVMIIPPKQQQQAQVSRTRHHTNHLQLHNSTRLKMEQQQTRAFGKVLQQQHSSYASTSGIEKNNNKKHTRPDPTKNLWNPSPSKRPRNTTTRREFANNNCGSSNSNIYRGRDYPPTKQINDEDDDEEEDKDEVDSHDKENAAVSRRYFPETLLLKPSTITTTTSTAAAVIPYNDNDHAIISTSSAALLTNTTTTDLNNSFTEKISNLDLGLKTHQHQESPSPCFSTSTSTSSSTPLLPPLPLLQQQTNNKCNSNWVESLDADYDYITEILNYWHTLELTYKVNPNYMIKQLEISYKMRTILVDWLVEVVDEYRIAEATLHRAVQFVDRFLSKLQISRSNLQLLGTTCLFIACKVEEVQPPDTSDLVYITDNTYDKTQLLKMECLVLSVLDFDLLTPTCYEFTEYFSNTLQLSPTAKEFCHYIIELALLDGERYLKYPQSILSMASCYVAIRCCGIGSQQHLNSSPIPLTLKSTLSRVRRLNSTPEYERCVNEAAGNIYVTLLNTSRITTSSSSSDASSTTPINSVCTKYSRFQDQKYIVAAASLAATCSSSSVWC